MASSDSTAIPIKNQAYRVYFPLLDADGDLVSGATALDSEISKDSGAFTDCTSEATELGSSGMYYLDLTATEMNADGVVLIIKSTTAGLKTTPIVMYPAEDTDIPVNLKSISDAVQSVTDFKDFVDTGYNPSTHRVSSNVQQVDSDTQAASNLKSFVNQGYDHYSYKIEGVKLADTTTTNTDMVGTNGANTTTPPTVAQIRAEMESPGYSLFNIDYNTTALCANQGNWVTATGFATQNPPSQNLADYKATGFSVPNEYDTVIAALQTDLDNPNQYKANVSNLDVAVSTRSSHTAANVWSVTTRSLTDKAGFALSTNGIKAIWDQATSALTTIGSLGKLVVDNLNATISSRSPSSEYDTEMSRLDVNVSSRNAIAPNTVIPDVAGTAATLHGITNGKIDVIDSIVDAIKLQTDNLPSGIAKNEALPKFDVFMVLVDHITAATGKTITGEISKDGGAFAAITNPITEVSNGLYTIALGLTQTEMNADVITLKFVCSGCDTRMITIITS